MVRAGGVISERGKHGEVSGYAGRRHKGESVGKGTAGVWEVNTRGVSREKVREFENGVYTIFVDNLSKTVMKGELFKDFFGYGIIKDVFVSRKWRRNSSSPFAFIRRDQGMWFRGTGQNFKGREERKTSNKHPQSQLGGGMIRKRWIPTGRKFHDQNTERIKKMENVGRCCKGGCCRTQRKEVNLSRSQTQSDILSRSLLGFNTKPIEFAHVESTLLREWDGEGVIECRDVGPFRCLITFESEKIRDEAMENQVLLSLFDEVRHHWGAVWSLSRRVLVEVMGLPTFLWSEGNLEIIAKIWGRYVYVDDRTENSWSFSVARFLIDSYEWEAIHEWITVKVDDKEYEVFVKEFGSEVYSRETHPNETEMAYMGLDAGKAETESMVEETPFQSEKMISATAGDRDTNLNFHIVASVPVIEVRVGELNEGVDEGGGGVMETMHASDGGRGRLNVDDDYGCDSKGAENQNGCLGCEASEAHELDEVAANKSPCTMSGPTQTQALSLQGLAHVPTKTMSMAIIPGLRIWSVR
ncbi:hypothetical protein PIB30_022970 [Stylosanthes scabra]|uniref:RRM domain-containing protein n=1 Tax=Stylosanthes scabra TaxID=79078 RepID=A0ABU6S8V2_9FABA|nr:hypothetical protein [Stylosanthes scabra]